MPHTEAILHTTSPLYTLIVIDTATKKIYFPFFRVSYKWNWGSQVELVVKNLSSVQETQVWSLG